MNVHAIFYLFVGRTPHFKVELRVICSTLLRLYLSNHLNMEYV